MNLDSQIIAIIISIISLAFGGYGAYHKWREGKPTIILSLESTLNFSGIAGQGNPEGKVNIKLTVKNIGSKTVFINSTGIELPNNMIFASLKNSRLLPAELPPEKNIIFTFEAAKLIAKLQSLGFRSKKEVVGIVTDEIGRKYKSEPTVINFNELKLWQGVLDNEEYK